jgi:CO/xanthine dehydrogenase Mo-binding subunit
VLRFPHAQARIASIRTDAARRRPGVLAVLMSEFSAHAFTLPIAFRIGQLPANNSCCRVQMLSLRD